jgi:excisionase family DNA binding protein
MNDMETISVKEAAAMLGYSESTVRRRIDSGELPAFAQGANLRLPREAVERAAATATSTANVAPAPDVDWLAQRCDSAMDHVCRRRPRRRVSHRAEIARITSP